jgi:hypothetical protein
MSQGDKQEGSKKEAATRGGEAASRGAVCLEAAQVVENLWRAAEQAAQQKNMSSRPNWGERPINQLERNAITSLVYYQAEVTGISAFDINQEVLVLFGVADLEEIKAWNFDEVIRFLTDFDGREPRPAL